MHFQTSTCWYLEDMVYSPPRHPPPRGGEGIGDRQEAGKTKEHRICFSQGALQEPCPQSSMILAPEDSPKCWNASSSLNLRMRNDTCRCSSWQRRCRSGCGNGSV